VPKGKEAFLNKKTLFSVDGGSWRDYCLGEFDKAIILDDNEDLAQASGPCYVNPITTVGAVETILKKNPKAVI